MSPAQTAPEALADAVQNGEQTAATVRALKQLDRDLMTARELVRAAIRTGGETVVWPLIEGRIKAALAACPKVEG